MNELEDLIEKHKLIETCFRILSNLHYFLVGVLSHFYLYFLL